MNSRRDLRIALGAAAVLPVAEAVERLPIGRDVAKAWLERRGLIRRLADLPAPVVVWADVLEELRRPDPPPEGAPRRSLRRGGIT